MAQFGYAAPHIDAWGVQIYRGRDFGSGREDFLSNYESATPFNARGEKVGIPRPIIVVEYGIDAYNDPCGKGYDTVRGKTKKSREGVRAGAETDARFCSRYSPRALFVCFLFLSAAVLQ